MRPECWKPQNKQGVSSVPTSHEDLRTKHGFNIKTVIIREWKCGIQANLKLTQKDFKEMCLWPGLWATPRPPGGHVYSPQLGGLLGNTSLRCIQFSKFHILMGQIGTLRHRAALELFTKLSVNTSGRPSSLWGL